VYIVHGTDDMHSLAQSLPFTDILGDFDWVAPHFHPGSFGSSGVGPEKFCPIVEVHVIPQTVCNDNPTFQDRV